MQSFGVPATEVVEPTGLSRPPFYHDSRNIITSHAGYVHGYIHETLWVGYTSVDDNNGSPPNQLNLPIFTVNESTQLSRCTRHPTGVSRM